MDRMYDNPNWINIKASYRHSSDRVPTIFDFVDYEDKEFVLDLFFHGAYLPDNFWTVFYRLVTNSGFRARHNIVLGAVEHGGLKRYIHIPENKIENAMLEVVEELNKSKRRDYDRWSY